MTKKTVLITGCSGGIGLACARELQRRGYQVLATCRKPQDIQRLNAMGLTTIQLDLEDPASVQQAASEVIRLSDNRLYGLFNNAGYGLYGNLISIQRQQLEQQFAANFFAVHQLTTLLLPAMLPYQQGRIIINSSVIGQITTPGRGAYAASKHALEAWADTLRMELHGTGIQVSLIEPGPINSDFSSKVQQSDPHHPVTNGNLVGRFALEPQAVVNKVCHALESRRPAIRYPVTTIAYLALILKRLLPARMLDKLVREVAGNSGK